MTGCVNVMSKNELTVISVYFYVTASKTIAKRFKKGEVINMFDIRKIQEQVIFNSVKDASDEKTAKQIVYGDHDQHITSGNSLWVKSTMQRLESSFDKATLKQIRMNCQCGYGINERLSFIKELIELSSSMEEFANQESAKAAGLFCIDGVLYLQFKSCPCPMLSEVDQLDTDTWCQCTTGYSKVLFEKAFGCEVKVELLKSIKMGHEICLMKIIVPSSVWS